ncbi:hypothetical protein [Streptomyces collinus]
MSPAPATGGGVLPHRAHFHLDQRADRPLAHSAGRDDEPARW